MSFNISLAGESIATQYNHLRVNQAVGGHHAFELHLANEDRAAHFTGSLAESSKKWIGKPLEIEGFFKGIVTSVGLSRARTGGSDFVVRGQSPTVFLDDGIHTRSFGEKILKKILDEVMTKYDSKFPEKSIDPHNPQKGKKIKYCVQYRESNFAFMNRLAARYGEWFYYDGEKLIFGKPTEGGTLRLNFETDLTHFDLSVKTVPVNFELKIYDYKKHEYPTKKSDYKTPENEYAKIAFEKSKTDIYPQTSEMPINIGMNQDDLDQVATLRQNVHLNELVVLSGASTRQDLKLGSVIEIVDPRSSLVASGNDNYGKYIITHLTHEFLTHGEGYSNHFEAIPAEAAIPPLSISPDPPPCEMQEGEVVENNDPDGMGRIRVQFIWQKEAQGDDAKTPWMRMASASGGGDKGFYLVPEKGDQVLVAFEHSHPERPYGLTGMYHGKAKPEHHDPENLKKSLKTKGGHQFLMNDEKGKESMALSSPSEFSVSSGQKTSVTAGTDIALKGGGSITVDASGTITITGGGDILIKSGSLVGINAPDIVLTGGTSVSISAPKIAIDGKTTGVTGSATLDLSGAVIGVSASGALDMSAGGIASVSGTVLKLN